MYHGNIDVPTFAYFDFGNTWTGSFLGDLNYRIVPASRDEGKSLEVDIWYGKNCFEKSEPADHFSEDFSPEGYDRVIERVNAIIDEHRVRLSGATN